MRGFSADWVIPSGAEAVPIADGAVIFDDQGCVVAVGEGHALRASHAAASWSHEQAILMPGLVNAHTHLELSSLRGQTRSGGGFAPWALSMMEARQKLYPEQDFEAIEAAVSELVRLGTAAVGEVTNSLASIEALSSAPLIGCVFHEVFGITRARGEAMRTAAREARDDLSHWPENLRYTRAPHTLFSLHPDIVRALVEDARESGLRTSLHLSEHAAERAFLLEGSGPLADYLASRALDAPDWSFPGTSPVDYAKALGVLARDVIAVHLCATTPDELRLVAEAGAPAVLCPRSNLFIELKLPPLYDVLSAGLRPGLGTDSLASNTTLDVLAEAAALRERFPRVEAMLLLRMATWYGAVALDLTHRVGALAPGLAPGLVAFEIKNQVADPAAFLLRFPSTPRRVLVRPGART
jgi:cytosine/adenosine deaminase-related metal-dependent hydrolase